MSTSKTVTVRAGSHAYDVHIGRGIINRLPRLLSPLVRERRALLVVDAGIAGGIGARVENMLRKAGWRIDTTSLPRGEKAKSLASLNKLYGFMLRKKVERRTPLIAVGGGALGDAAGFAAATYYRGIPLVHVPTTLLAAVDSAIGGKTAINHALAKNAIGAFYQPVLTLADVDSFKTLPARDMRAGMGEVVKYAFVFDRAFGHWLESHWQRAVLNKEAASLIPMIQRCVALKAAVVGADERDLSGRRELLNFGHTIGHAIESASGYRRFRHGEAVALGMRAAIEISRGRGWLSRKSDLALMHGLLRRLPTPPWPRGLKQRDILAALARDKKATNSKNIFILLKEIGKPVRVSDVSRDEIQSALTRTLSEAI